MTPINAIKFYRKKAGLTALKLSHLVGVSDDTIARWESGQREPRVSDLKKLCEVFKISEAELLNGPQKNGIVIKIQVKQEMEEVDIDMTQTGDYIETITLTPGRIGLGIVFDESTPLEKVFEEILKNKDRFTKAKQAAYVGA